MFTYTYICTYTQGAGLYIVRSPLSLSVILQRAREKSKAGILNVAETMAEKAPLLTVTLGIVGGISLLAAAAAGGAALAKRSGTGTA